MLSRVEIYFARHTSKCENCLVTYKRSGIKIWVPVDVTALI
jgi:hypothetical protein